MRAIRVHQFGDPSVLTLDEVPTPEPGPGQVQVRIHAVGVNPVETYIRSGRYANLPTPPFIPGSDAAGVVSALGPGVTQWSTGDRVFFFGTAAGRSLGAYAEYTVCDAKLVFRLPDSVNFGQGAALGVPYATAHRALFARGGGKVGETVMVHGASGGVGLAAVQFARWVGLNVAGTAGTEEGLNLVRASGAHVAVSHRAPLYLDQIRAATNGRGPDLILEMLANVNLDHDLDLIAPQGRIVIIGNRGRIEIDPRKVMSREAEIIGVMLWHATDAELAESYADVVAGLEKGALRPVVGRELPLADAAKAHDAVMAPGSKGKVVLIP
jgi:NADPH:quinone reductase